MEIPTHDREILDRILAAIRDPATPAERREELRAEYSSIAEGYIFADAED